MKKGVIFWCTGLSGSGKTTLANHAKKDLEETGISVMIVDGDKVRSSYKEKLGFGRSDIEKNNMHIVTICESERKNYDVLIVPVISPIDEVRKITRKKLEPFYYSIYLSCDLNSLTNRDPKGLYDKAKKGEIANLIGYSPSNPYDIPMDADFTLNTSSSSTLDESKKAFGSFIIKKLSELGLLHNV
jgi:adenylylsulfate kinase